MAKYPSTIPGFRNRNGQQVVECTGWASESMPGQKIYRLRCTGCKREYGANGCDIHERRCPFHQGGSPGETLRTERTLSLFETQDV